MPYSPPPPVLKLKESLWGAGGGLTQLRCHFLEGRGHGSRQSNGRKWPVVMGRGTCSPQPVWL